MSKNFVKYYVSNYTLVNALNIKLFQHVYIFEHFFQLIFLFYKIWNFRYFSLFSSMKNK